MRFGCVFLLLAAVAPAQQLRVKAASTRSTQLEWDGSAAGWTVERKAEGGSYEKIGTVQAANFEDAKIQPYATYHYRVSVGAGAKSSNEVIVGPPPSGVLAPALAPKGTDAGHYGVNTAMAMDENGDPAIAFVWFDPNGDTNPDDTEVRFVRWSRAARAWSKPVKVVTTGEIPSQNVEPVSLACDPKTGTLAVVTPIAGPGLVMAISKDGGSSWQTVPLSALVSGTVSSTAIAIRDDHAHLAVNSDPAEVRYLTGALNDDPSKWQNQAVPATSGWKRPPGVNVGLALDGAGKPVLAWYEAKEEGDGRRVMVWRPDGQPQIAFESQQGTDGPNLALAAGAGRVGVLVHTLFAADKGDFGIWYTSSADGTTWTKPVMVPVDGPRSTNSPESVAIDSRGRVVAVFGSNSGSAGPPCGSPMVSRSTDGLKWTTCGLGRAAGAEFGSQPVTVHVLFGGDEKSYILWQEPGENKYGQGVLLWHER